MMREVSSFGHFAKVPSAIIVSSISARAKSVWNLMALFASDRNPSVWVRQQTFAEKLGCSTDTIYRAIKELVDLGLLIETERKYLGRYKTYIMNHFANAQSKNAHPGFKRSSADMYRKNAEGSTANLRDDVPQKCGTINRVSTTDQKSEYFFSPARDQDSKVGDDSELSSLMKAFENEWKEKFPSLDGKSGRPSLKECIEIALVHDSRRRYSNLKIFLDGWLRNASARWISSFNREQNAPATSATLDAEAIARKCADEQKSREELQKAREERRKKDDEAMREEREKTLANNSEAPESEEETAWIASRIKADLEKEKIEAEKKKRAFSTPFEKKMHALALAPIKEISKDKYPMRWSLYRFEWKQNHIRQAA